VAGFLARYSGGTRLVYSSDLRMLLAWCSSHDLRHTGATLAAAVGAPLRALMSRLGHSSSAAAIRYQHVLDGQDAAIARYLDALASAHNSPSTTASDNERPSEKGTRRARHLTQRKQSKSLNRG